MFIALKLPQKRLDRSAYCLVALTVFLILLSVWGRVSLNQARLDQRIYGLSGSPEQHLWISLPKQVVITDRYGDIQQRYDWSSLGLSEPAMNVLFGDHHLWMRTVGGQVYRCSRSPAQHCTVIKRQWPENGYVSLSLSANRQFVIAVSNDDGRIYVYQTEQGDLIRTIDRHQLTQLGALTDTPTAHHAKGLYKANNSWSDHERFVQANTGYARLDQWPISPNGEPNFDVEAQTILQTQGQPYFVNALGHRWYVLEGQMSLSNGQLKTYSQTNGARTDGRLVPLPIQDPVSMVQIGNTLFLSNLATPEIAAVTVSPESNDAETSTLMRSPALTPILNDILSRQTLLKRLTAVCLGLMIFWPVCLILWLKHRGYNLNQAL
jgi:hypothetical protein